MLPLILASSSPRRQQLLREAGYEFTVLPPTPEAETPHEGNEAAAMLVAFLTMRGRLLPVAYMVWGAALVHFVASVVLWLAPGVFAHDVASHVADGLAFVLALLACLPLLLSVSFYLFEYPFAYKLGGTLLVAGALVVIAPYQYLVHTLVLARWTLLPMPLLYVTFGLVFDIAVFIALYGWLMSREA